MSRIFTLGPATRQSIQSRKLTSAIMAGLVSVLLTAAALPLSAASTKAVATDADVQAPVLAPLATHSRTAQIVVQQLRRNHYVDLKVNDALSSDMFDNYLEALDPGRYYFLAADIAEFEGYRYELDNALRRGDLLPAYRMFNRLQQRLIERTEYMQQTNANMLVLCQLPREPVGPRGRRVLRRHGALFLRLGEAHRLRLR